MNRAHVAQTLLAASACALWLLRRAARRRARPSSASASLGSALLERTRQLDAADELAHLRARFAFPRGVPVYLCGHSLGLQPDRAAQLVADELVQWATLGERGHFTGPSWLSYHERVRAPLARLVGAREHEVVAMNSLTVNLHLLMASFYAPTAARHAIVIEGGAFPSDRYAVTSHAALRGYGGADGSGAVRELWPEAAGGETLRTEAILAWIEEHGGGVALMLLSGVQYYTGQLFDIAAITAAARARGIVVGWDLAHAAGNVPLALHEWGVDFAAWCSYKYLNGARARRAPQLPPPSSPSRARSRTAAAAPARAAGPGAIGGAFVHDTHCGADALAAGRAPKRMAGWWGNDAATRFRMGPDFVPAPGADGWQLSNPPIFQLAALRGSLELFDAAGLGRLRAKAVRLTEHALELLAALEEELPRPKGGAGHFDVITPRDASARGAQLSVRVRPADSGADRAAAVQAELARAHGVECDYRRPHVLRVGLCPLYVSFGDVHAFVCALGHCLRHMPPAE